MTIDNTAAISVSAWKRMQFLAVTGFIGTLIFGFISVFLLWHGYRANVSGTVSQLQIGSAADGNMVVLTGDGFRLLDGKGKELASLGYTHENAKLTLDGTKASTWLAPEMWDMTSQDGKGGVTLSSDNASGGDIRVQSNLNTASISEVGFRIDSSCDKVGCPDRVVQLNSLLGFEMQACPHQVDSSQTEKHCMTVRASAPDLDTGGPSIALEEDDMTRLAIGVSKLTNRITGGEETTPASKIVAFDKKGNVIWSSPP